MPSRVSNRPRKIARYRFFIRLSANALDSSFIAARVFAHTNNPPVFSSSLCTGLGFPSAPPAPAGSPSHGRNTARSALSALHPLDVSDPLPTDTTSSGFTTIAQCASSYATATSSYVPSALSLAPARAASADPAVGSRTSTTSPASTKVSHVPRESLTWTKPRRHARLALVRVS